MKRVVLSAGLAMLLAAGACRSGGGHAPASAWRPDIRPFGKDSPLRMPLPKDVVLHPHSQEMIADLYGHCREARLGSCKFPRLAGVPDAGQSFTDFGTPIYFALPATRRRTIECTRFACGVQGVRNEDTRALFDVPIPAGARPDPSPDAHLVVYDPARGLSWELFGARYSPGTGHWKTLGGIRWDLNGPGYDAIGEPGTAVGAGVPMFGTVLRPEEIRDALNDGTGVVPHILSGGYDSPRTRCFIGPLAKTTDGDDGRQWAIPEGAILQLDPALNIDKLGLTPAAKVIARTLQRYGMVIRDDAGAFQIDMENVAAEATVDPDRARLWDALGLHKDSLQPLQGNLFDVVAWNAAQAHGTNCL
jgi:hypothetical protein